MLDQVQKYVFECGYDGANAGDRQPRLAQTTYERVGFKGTILQGYVDAAAEGIRLEHFGHPAQRFQGGT